MVYNFLQPAVGDSVFLSGGKVTMMTYINVRVLPLNLASIILSIKVASLINELRKFIKYFKLKRVKNSKDSQN